jgi:hypothetical protein
LGPKGITLENFLGVCLRHCCRKNLREESAAALHIDASMIKYVTNKIIDNMPLSMLCPNEEENDIISLGELKQRDVLGIEALRYQKAK